MNGITTSQQLEDRRLKSNRIWLALVYALGMAFSLCLVLAAGYWIHSVLIKKSLKQELQLLAEKEAGVHLTDLQEWASGLRTAADVNVGLRPHRMAFYYILSSDAELVHGNESHPELRPVLLALLKSRELPQGQVVFRNLQPDNEPELRLALLRHPVMSEGRYLGSVYAATDIGDSLAHLDQLLRTGLLLALGFALLASLGGWWMADRSLQPLRRALQHQRRFIADASHELRAPLTVLTTALAVVNKEATAQLSEFHRQTLADALDETRRLNRMTDELLLLARADAGVLQANIQSIRLQPLIEQRLRLCQPLVEEKQLHVTLQLPPDLTINADSDLLRRLLSAALDNALQYTPNGGFLRIEAHGKGKKLLLRLSNNCSNLLPLNTRQIFKRFYRGDPARQRNRQGSGLGLAIIQEIMLAHGGQVWIDYSKTTGFCLTCSFPVSVEFQKKTVALRDQ